jgi:hypothetical protein
MKSKIVTLIITAIGLALLVFTALRTLDLIQLALPADQQITGYLALVAFDGGLIAWTLFYLHGARGAWQRAIAAIMIVVSLTGVLIAFGADMLYSAEQRGTIATLDPAIITGAIWAMVFIIGATVAAVIGIHLTDPEARRMQAEEEARDKITEAALKQIAAHADSLAAELAPQLGAAWLADMRARYIDGLPASTGESQTRPPRPRAPARQLSPTSDYSLEDTQPQLPLAADPRPAGGKARSNGNGKHP